MSKYLLFRSMRRWHMKAAQVNISGNPLQFFGSHFTHLHISSLLHIYFLPPWTSVTSMPRDQTFRRQILPRAKVIGLRTPLVSLPPTLSPRPRLRLSECAEQHSNLPLVQWSQSEM